MPHSLIKSIADLDQKILKLLEKKYELISSHADEDTLMELRARAPEQDSQIPASLLKDFNLRLLDYSSAKKQPTVAYLGPEATNTHQAARDIFGIQGIFSPQPTINEIFSQVEEGSVRYGVVPIENSTEGTIYLTLDLLRDSPLHIYGEKTNTIHHFLMGHGKRQEIREVLSHPQVLGQCRQWLDKNLPGVKRIEFSSSAAAVEAIRHHPYQAAIGTAIASELYKCPILESNIQDSKTNKTRFFILSREARKPGKHNKTSLVFLCPDQPGALVEVLKIFRKHGINLSKIESRPSKRQDWEYYFYVDFNGHEKDPASARALLELKKKTFYMRVLGSYPRG